MDLDLVLVLAPVLSLSMDLLIVDHGERKTDGCGRWRGSDIRQ